MYFLINVQLIIVHIKLVENSMKICRSLIGFIYIYFFRLFLKTIGLISPWLNTSGVHVLFNIKINHCKYRLLQTTNQLQSNLAENILETDDSSFGNDPASFHWRDTGESMERHNFKFFFSKNHQSNFKETRHKTFLDKGDLSSIK